MTTQRKKAFNPALAAVLGDSTPEPDVDDDEITVSEPPTKPAPVKTRPVRKGSASPFRPYVPPVSEETVQLNVRIPKPLMARVKALHKDTDEPIKSMVERALEALCDNEENR